LESVISDSRDKFGSLFKCLCILMTFLNEDINGEIVDDAAEQLKRIDKLLEGK